MTPSSRATDITRWAVWDKHGIYGPKLRDFAALAAAWEGLRLKLETPDAVPADAETFKVLSERMREFCARLKLPTCSEQKTDVVIGCTDSRGFIPGDPARILSHWTWRDSGRLSRLSHDDVMAEWERSER
ncbi:hypothetical protein JDV09_16915 [Mycobacterium sp. Y57]|uniref:hypothetical protein n=1 Tax=Mycolicibacterium xanthum TaxID=2796469 RepID=UPI001C85E0BB|nr:hypothetical protein [Mycolicibacterium xanthum]MBX7433777.1 hypothetical protein [Mycolicibacterium xanthum]